MIEKEISIGKIGYSISLEEDIRLDECLEAFVNTGSAEIDSTCRLTVARQEGEPSVPKLRSRHSRIFEAGGSWGLYQTETPEMTLAVPSLRRRQRVRLLGRVDNGFRRGVLRAIEGGECYLSYPFLEVLTIGLLGRAAGVLLHA